MKCGHKIPYLSACITFIIFRSAIKDTKEGLGELSDHLLTATSNVLCLKCSLECEVEI